MAGKYYFLMNKMVPFPVTRSEGRRLLPITNYKRLPHSFEFDLSQVEDSGTWSSFVREACLHKTGEEVPRATICQE